jgi:hypothetical protein
MSNVIYGPLELPSGKQIKFRKPVGMDRMNILNAMSISEDDAVKAGILLNSYLAAKVVTEVDGIAVTDGNYKAIFNDWDDADIQYYQAVNSTMFGLTEAKIEDAKAKAAFLLNSLTSTDGFNSQNPATVPLNIGSDAMMN